MNPAQTQRHHEFPSFWKLLHPSQNEDVEYFLVDQGQNGEAIMRLPKDGSHPSNVMFPTTTGFGTHKDTIELTKRVVDFLNQP